MNFLTEHSFDLIGITKAISLPIQESFQEWIDKGYHAGMSYLQKNAPKRLSPGSLLPDAQFLILVGLNYYQKPSSLTREEGRIARYAWGKDYHQVLGNKLEKLVLEMGQRFPKEKFRWGVDATPLSERTYGFLSGIGFIGKNHLLIHRIYGSWFFLGEILTTLDLSSQESFPMQKDCGQCTKCIDACPTQALTQPFQINANRCISYLTIENRKEIPEELREKIGDCLFGCDICQEVCPYNQKVSVTKEEEFLQHKAGPKQNLQEILEIESEEEFQKKYANTPILRAKRQGLLRNACVVAANQKAFSLIPLLEKRAKDSNHLIAQHASWAIKKLGIRIKR